MNIDKVRTMARLIIVVLHRIILNTFFYSQRHSSEYLCRNSEMWHFKIPQRERLHPQNYFSDCIYPFTQRLFNTNWNKLIFGHPRCYHCCLSKLKDVISLRYCLLSYEILWFLQYLVQRI